MRRRLAVVALGTTLLIGGTPVMSLAQPPAPEEQDCTRRAGEGRPADALRPAVKLQPDVSEHAVNFGGSRGWQFVDVVLNAAPALPAALEPRAIRFEVLRRLARTANDLPSKATPFPTFTEPRISPGRDRITFTVCLDGRDLEPGTYAGSVLIEGPKGLSPTSISLVQNAKDRALALWSGFLVLLVAFALLVLRGAGERQARSAEAVAEDLSTEDADKRTAALDERRKISTRPLRSYISEVFKDLNWWLTSIVGLGLAAGTLYGIYSANPAWGADPVASVISFVGPAFTAVGLQSVVTSLGRSVRR